MTVDAEKIRIAIIGAGFSGTALAANILRAHPTRAIEIFLIDKRGVFGLGEAYSTPFAYHLLNVRAHDMSAFEDDKSHFVDWLHTVPYPPAQLDAHLPMPKRFVPRMLYGQYLQALLASMRDKVQVVANEVTDIVAQGKSAQLHLRDGSTLTVDKVVLALGNGTPSKFPFPVINTKCINNPWDFHAPKAIPKNDSILIVGTGLSMIDAVLTLHHNHHQGKIYALSRHGLLPLAHTEEHISDIDLENIPLAELSILSKKIRQQIKTLLQEGGDWRSVIQALRPRLPEYWQAASDMHKKRFLRHILPYWNVHRHRVHQKIAALLAKMTTEQQLKIISGRVLRVQDGVADIQIRHQQIVTQIKTAWIINCMGPPQRLLTQAQTIIHALQAKGMVSFDSLNLGLAITTKGEVIEASGQASPFLYALGPPTKGMRWEATAVPDIRKQCLAIAKNII